MTSALTLKVSQDKVHPVTLQLSKDDSERFRNTEPGPWAQQPWNMFLIYMLKETHKSNFISREAPIHFYEQRKMMYCYKIRQVFWTAFQMDHWVSNQNFLCTFYCKNFGQSPNLCVKNQTKPPKLSSSLHGPGLGDKCTLVQESKPVNGLPTSLCNVPWRKGEIKKVPWHWHVHTAISKMDNQPTD